MQSLALPDVAYLRECFDYDPDSGFLTWKTRPPEHFSSTKEWRRANTLRAGKIAGSLSCDDYFVVSINGQSYKVSRVIWKMQTGIEPNEEVDHKNRIPSDNSWKNLREATHQQNRFNRRGWTDLPKGVHRHGKKYTSRPYINGRISYLGSFDTPEEAHAAYLAHIRPLAGEFFYSGGDN